MYAIVKTGGKQYRVEQGQSLLVERLPVGEGDTVALETLMVRGEGDAVAFEAKELAGAKVEAKVLAHERGPKLRVVKFKPKRGYRRGTQAGAQPHRGDEHRPRVCRQEACRSKA
jgi:large subunit ribosomal protein L21